MPTIYEHNNFSILSIPKVGSANLQKWCFDNNITTVTNVQPKNKPLYAFWRSPETRIPSGLATNINELVYSIHNIDEHLWNYNQHKQLYHDVISQWCAYPTHDPMSVAGVVCEGQHHCPMPTWLDGYAITPTHWIPLEQLSLFPAYLNNKYNTNFTTDIQDADEHPDQKNWLPWRIFVEHCTPQGLEFIEFLIKRDNYRPQELYNINATDTI